MSLLSYLGHCCLHAHTFCDGGGCHSVDCKDPIPIEASLHGIIQILNTNIAQLMEIMDNQFLWLSEDIPWRGTLWLHTVSCQLQWHSQMQRASGWSASGKTLNCHHLLRWCLQLNLFLIFLSPCREFPHLEGCTVVWGIIICTLSHSFMLAYGQWITHTEYCLDNHNDKSYYTVKDVELCKQKCLEETSFTCCSLEQFSIYCTISADSVRTFPEDIEQPCLLSVQYLERDIPGEFSCCFTPRGH